MSFRDVLRGLNKLRKDMTMDEYGRNYYDEDGNKVDYSQPGAGYWKDLTRAYRGDIHRLANGHTRSELEAMLEDEQRTLTDPETSPWGASQAREQITKLREALKMHDPWGA